MKKDEIHLSDWERILWGMAPPEFFIEVLFRTLFIYLFLLIIMRFLGKRMNGQLSITEMAVMLTTGAIISPSMQAPDRGIALGIFAMICALVYQRLTTLWGFNNKKIEKIMQGTVSVLVIDGVIQVDSLAGNRVSRQQLFTELRRKSVYNLGQAKRVYLEASGLFSIYERKEALPGLSTLPPNVADEEIHNIQNVLDDTVACSFCGQSVPKSEKSNPCPTCQSSDWADAVL